ncbi:MAG: hypothetical protein DHS20C18_14500 [Saprospiraceae bacterium]|nr:MAG: hypothetical protein DHS20C18_14500 [Saprospiraceae bacterium]
MKIFIYSLVIASLLVSCQSDSSESVNETEAPASNVQSQQKRETPAGEDEQKKVVPGESSKLEASNDQFTLMVGEGSAKTGEPICLDVSAANFKDMISMQYSFRWNPELLKLNGVEQFQLPGLEASNFGLHRIAEGILTFVWIKEDLKGVNRENGASLFQLCFTVLGGAGEEATVRIWDSPTAFEAVNEREELQPYHTKKGKVVIQ